MVQHREQIASVLRRAVQTVLSRGLADPRVKGMVSVTEVKVSPDLRHATVMVSVLPEDVSKTTMKGLTAAAKHVRHLVSNEVQMRRVPELSFKLDQSLKKQAEVLAALDEAGRRRVDRPETDNEQDAADAAPGNDEPATEERRP